MPNEEKNMAKGENIFKRKDGRWEARFVKGYDSAGKIRYGYCYGKSYKEAKEKSKRRKMNLVPIRSRESRTANGIFLIIVMSGSASIVTGSRNPLL